MSRPRIYSVGDIRECSAGHSYAVTERMWLAKEMRCPDCRREYLKRRNAIQREEGRFRTDAWRARNRRYRLANLERLRAWHREWSKSQPKRPRRPQKYHPVKSRARWHVWLALKEGRLVRQPCRCGQPKAEAHHADYRKPLDVVWLCLKCHRDEHNRLRALGQEPAW